MRISNFYFLTFSLFSSLAFFSFWLDFFDRLVQGSWLWHFFCLCWVSLDIWGLAGIYARITPFNSISNVNRAILSFFRNSNSSRPSQRIHYINSVLNGAFRSLLVLLLISTYLRYPRVGQFLGNSDNWIVFAK